MAVVTKGGKQEQGGRQDPGPRDELTEDVGRQDPEDFEVAEGFTKFGCLVNRDPRLHYHFANKHGMYDVSYFRALGYKVVTYERDGVQLTMGQDSHDEGAPIESMGQVLMAVPVERWKKIVAVAQGRADAMEKYLSSTPGEVDPMRGRHGMGNQYRALNVPRGISVTQDIKSSVYTEQG